MLPDFTHLGFCQALLMQDGQQTTTLLAQTQASRTPGRLLHLRSHQYARTRGGAMAARVPASSMSLAPASARSGLRKERCAYPSNETARSVPSLSTRHAPTTSPPS